MKQIDSVLSCVCSLIHYRRRQNVVRISVNHSLNSSCALFLFLQRFDVICDLLLSRRNMESIVNSCIKTQCRLKSELIAVNNSVEMNVYVPHNHDASSAT